MHEGRSPGGLWLWECFGENETQGEVSLLFLRCTWVWSHIQELLQPKEEDGN